MAFQPVLASQIITQKYKRYLKTSFALDDVEYNTQFRNAVDQADCFAKGPYLDVLDAFEKGKSPSALIADGTIPTGFSRLALHQDRTLYLHQQLALQTAMSGNNMVVSTGTGSGKTESFLVPILAHLLREKEAGTLCSGVRALLIYPMNALANDQIERLRELLADCPEITYGSYTGQTKRTQAEALEDYKKLNDGKLPPANELISREVIKQNPPHILVTNYAMLEYLMVRPDDNVFFHPSRAKYWKFIVLDEAHVYTGSTGIEVSMLLRRLKATLEGANLQYILTSATLGDENSNDAVAKFASNLCAAPFDASNVIRAHRQTPQKHDTHFATTPVFFRAIAQLLEDGAPDSNVISEINAQIGTDYSGDAVGPVLYDLFLKDDTFWKMRNLTQDTKTVASLCKSLNWTEEELADCVRVLTKATKNGAKLFDAKYHMFLRAPESVFITLAPHKELFLARKRYHTQPDGQVFKVFEIGSCNSCHAIYLVGQIKDGKLELTGDMQSGKTELFLLSNDISDSDDDHALEDDGLQTEEYTLCPYCGHLRRKGAVTAGACEHGLEHAVKVFRVKRSNEGKRLTKCPACEATSAVSVLRMFFAGQEAVTSVVATALFEELPAYKVELKEVTQDADDFGFGFGEAEATQELTPQAKQFIAFSDSRQSAAFFASYMDATYQSILYKRLIAETLQQQVAKGTSMGMDDFIQCLTSQFRTYKIHANFSDTAVKKEAWKAVLAEMVDSNGSTSLSRMGLLGITFEDRYFPANPKLNLSAADVKALCSVFLLGMMQDTAIRSPMMMTDEDKEFYTHQGAEYSYTLSARDPARHQNAFIPARVGRSNKRTDYLHRVLEAKGKSLDDAVLGQCLSSIWERILVQRGLLVSDGGTYRVLATEAKVSREQKWYVCPECGKITMYNIADVCPTYRCTGKLIPIDPDEYYRDNHYYELYQHLDIRDLRIVEHTAQLDKETAYRYQKEFKNKQLDILSCSTTFEMGVDVGSLETVLMRNVPPTPANYAQRAGRAGRSSDSAAYALTFCNKSSHDFTQFASPEGMIHGKILPPSFNVENEKIAIRHVYASALAYFWRSYPHYFAKAVAMIETAEDGTSGIAQFAHYLNDKPSDLRDFLLRFLPKKLADEFGIMNFSWVDGLLDPESGKLSIAQAVYIDEITKLLNEREQLNKKQLSDGRILQRIKTFRNEEILAFLSRKGILPQYGFPVDTVALDIVASRDNALSGLQLQRDLSRAIAEYAPGSQVVANGDMITSRYIRKMPSMLWKMYDYAICDSCKSMVTDTHVTEDPQHDAQFAQCTCCGAPITRGKRTFLIPELGFIADSNATKKPGLLRPQRTYNNEIAYIHRDNTTPFEAVQCAGAQIEMRVSPDDEMALVNASQFFVCEQCGYTELENIYLPFMKKVHKNASGYPCKCNSLKHYDLGYRFKTDVAQIRFLDPVLPALSLEDWETAYSVLHGLLRGFCSFFSVDERDIAGTLQYFTHPQLNIGCYAIILYDGTPGGSGYVRMLQEPGALECVLRETLRLMQRCTCGGENADTSCYACLRNYYNQKHHEQLNRGSVIRFIRSVLE